MLICFMQRDVQELIREEVRAEMARKRMTQVELSKTVGMSRSHISACLTGSTDVLSSRWLKIFDVLGLELVLRKKKS